MEANEGALIGTSYPGGLVQIARRQGRIERVPRGETPVIELHLEPGQYIASVELESREYALGVDPGRKTVDWDFTAYVVAQLGGDGRG